MRGRGIKEIRGSSRGMYIGSTSYILPKWEDIRSSYIPPNLSDMRSIADIPKLCAMCNQRSNKNEN